jgi:hypothetical protein
MKPQRPRLGIVGGAVGETVGCVSSPESIAPPPADQAPMMVPRLLWGWPEVLAATGIPRRTLTLELAAGRFVRPVRRVGRRPYWDPAQIALWARGGRS